MAGRAAGIRASLHNAVRHGGPTTFTPKARPPISPAVHAIFVAQAITTARVLLRETVDSKGEATGTELALEMAHGSWGQNRREAAPDCRN
jgi:hypothetical protein